MFGTKDAALPIPGRGGALGYFLIATVSNGPP